MWCPPKLRILKLLEIMTKVNEKVLVASYVGYPMERKEYSVVMGWIHCRLSFAILRSAILCIRGSRSSRHHPVHEINIELATSEGRVPSAVH